MVDIGRYIYSIHGVYKATYNWAPPCSYGWFIVIDGEL